ncbi:precorrin-2 dehydrogenase/sirohydrochlorin ferrochelatase family protein [Halorubrum lacusprofundi]|uniref:precorrin-2 dehydrogenase n=1 Tax=Halorubrum lacusprofundi (strain ATCC 49239 / DSM 5036 / JCM 8891 / ACAM 34) TaxID=416348 RepID=B9LR54_HALLT|nr:bifunctional precorrin-2 dehydrogenase/sirohydrochlorin ferrochelatase [Halorubrum lacusprofundi]ACM57708.1 siroheme synthase [Halorubrum lacusprofundi ATCC 49239]MCG1005695.1 bifunctional precorrin-2 dehydrogenase/sirohydrochlorin ferrochelatase [Halorubrum lacusprofundi]
MIPLYHDFTGETVLVFGGGTVGSRKASRFADEARVVVVSPGFDDRLVDLAEEDRESVELVRATPDAEAIHGWIDRVDPALVVAATDDAAVNAAAEAAALDTGALVNRTDVSAGDRSGGRDVRSVVVPATIEDDPVRVALSTGGASPALAKALRERIEAEIDGAGAMAELSGTLRAELKDRDVPPEKRREAIRRVVRSEGVWKALQKGDSYGRQEADSVIEEVLNR